MAPSIAYRERRAHLRLERIVRQLLARENLSLDAIEAHAKRYKGSARSMMITHANLRDLMAALQKLDAMRKERQ